MAKGDDERHNPRRRPMSREMFRAVNMVKKAFPGTQEVQMPSNWVAPWDIEDARNNDNEGIGPTGKNWADLTGFSEGELKD